MAMPIQHNNESVHAPIVQSFILADHVYQDALTGKKIIAGTFNQLSSAEEATTLGRSVFAYLAIINCRTKLNLKLRYVDLTDESVLLESGIIELPPIDALGTLEVVMEVPPLPMPHPGMYAFEAYCNDQKIGSLRIAVTKE